MCSPILAQSRLDSKAVYFLSTIHKPEYDSDVPQTNRVEKRRGAAGTRGGVEVPCPPLLQDYNIGMGGVDFNDHQQKFYNLKRRSTRWYRRVFFYLLEVALHNSFVVKNASLSGQYRWKQSNGAMEFRIDLVNNLIGGIRAGCNIGCP